MKYSNKKDKENIRRLTVIFSLIVLAVLIVVLGISAITAYLLVGLGVIASEDGISATHIVIFVAISSVVMGTIISFISSKMILSPLNMVTSKIKSLANGNFGTRVDFDRIVSRVPSFLELSTVFNKLSEELRNTEMLRSDFINNFSHEFKTPIVSIRGFAKMLKRDDLTVEERNEYLDIIISESERLTELATSILNLSKIEQQTILTDRKKVNISEQIRLVIALLDNKWSEKYLDITFDCEEHFLYGNEEMLKQVWINLLENAIKFTPEGGRIKICLETKNETLNIRFQNDTSTLSDDVIKHVFDKFYQGDTSHTTKGNGLGLTLVKKIVELHNGEIKVDNSYANTFILEIIFQ